MTMIETIKALKSGDYTVNAVHFNTKSFFYQLNDSGEPELFSFTEDQAFKEATDEKLYAIAELTIAGTVVAAYDSEHDLETFHDDHDSMESIWNTIHQLNIDEEMHGEALGAIKDFKRDLLIKNLLDGDYIITADRKLRVRDPDEPQATFEAMVEYGEGWFNTHD